MPAQEQLGYAYDGFGSILGGMNGSVAPTLVPEGQAWNLVNVSCRGGKPKNRPRFVSKKLTFANVMASDGVTIVTPASSVKAAFLGGRFQGASYYTTDGNEWIYASIAGHFYRLTAQGSGFLVEDMTPDAGNDPTSDIAYFCQSNDYLVIQDGKSAATLINGSYLYRARPELFEMPTGTFMAYGYGRTWVAVANNSYLASDLIGEEPAAAVTFSDETYLAENANFDLPNTFGRIRGMAFINQQDTATGQGPLVVFGEHGAESVDVSLPRAQWQTTSIQQEALTLIGACGHRAIVAINGDLWFRSADGWRSYRQARAEQIGPNQVPQSTPVRPYTDLETPELLYFGSAINFNNRLMVTCNPQRSNVASVHSGMLSLDFDVLTIGINGQGIVPSWDGYWRPPAPVSQLLTGTFNGRRRAFAFTTTTTFASNGAGTTVNGLSEILEDGGPDVTGYDGNGYEITLPITSMLETRGFMCQPSLGANAAYTEKRMEYVDVYELNRTGATEIKVAYRGDGNLVYKPIADTTEAAPPPAVIGGPGGPLYTARSRSYVPNDDSTGADTRIDRRFYDCQLQFTWTGELDIHRVRLCAAVLPDSRVAGM